LESIFVAGPLTLDGGQEKDLTHHFTFHAKVARNFSVKYSFCAQKLLREIHFD